MLLQVYYWSSTSYLTACRCFCIFHPLPDRISSKKLQILTGARKSFPQHIFAQRGSEIILQKCKTCLSWRAVLTPRGGSVTIGPNKGAFLLHGKKVQSSRQTNYQISFECDSAQHQYDHDPLKVEHKFSTPSLGGLGGMAGIPCTEILIKLSTVRTILGMKGVPGQQRLSSLTSVSLSSRVLHFLQCMHWVRGADCLLIAMHEANNKLGIRRDCAGTIHLVKPVVGSSL